MITLASRKQIPAAVARCVRAYANSQHRAPPIAQIARSGFVANIDRAIYPGRKWCRIKRRHHRISHHPAVRVEDACYSVISVSYQTISKIRRGITFSPLLPLVTSEAARKAAAAGFSLSLKVA